MMPSLKTDNVAILNKDGFPVNLSIKWKDKPDNKPVAFILHGFKGFKEWGFLPYIQDKCAEKGAIAVAMDFAYNGISDRNAMVFDSSIFSRITMSEEVNDLKEGIDYIRNNYLTNNKINIAGHSMGGAIALAYSRKYNKVDKIALWATVAYVDRYTLRQKEHWKKQGYIQFNVSSTKQELRLNVDFLNDFEHNADDLNPLINIKQTKSPVLIIHGTQDLTVKKEEALLLKEAAGDNARLTLIEKTGHTFGVVHPFEKTNPALEIALNDTLEFFDLI